MMNSGCGTCWVSAVCGVRVCGKQGKEGSGATCKREPVSGSGRMESGSMRMDGMPCTCHAAYLEGKRARPVGTELLWKGRCCNLTGAGVPPGCVGTMRHRSTTSPSLPGSSYPVVHYVRCDLCPPQFWCVLSCAPKPNTATHLQLTFFHMHAHRPLAAR